MDLQKEYELFATELIQRCNAVGIDLRKYPIDHVCYRAKNIEAYTQFYNELLSVSTLVTGKIFHNRKFHCFFLKEPLTCSSISSYLIEFSEPGGSDDYDNGFQHLEILSSLSWKELTTDNRKFEAFLLSGKHDGIQSLKWPDKLTVKLTRKPLYYAATAEEDPTITVL